VIALEDPARFAALVAPAVDRVVIAVHVAARVMAQAQGNEILCSRSVRDLVAGSGFVFTDRGIHRLKGVPDDWQLYAVELT